jgi:hypothetical protein
MAATVEDERAASSARRDCGLSDGFAVVAQVTVQA